jgi:hypothetical protein
MGRNRAEKMGWVDTGECYSLRLRLVEGEQVLRVDWEGWVWGCRRIYGGLADKWLAKGPASHTLGGLDESSKFFPLDGYILEKSWQIRIRWRACMVSVLLFWHVGWNDCSRGGTPASRRKKGFVQSGYSLLCANVSSTKYTTWRGG